MDCTDMQILQSKVQHLHVGIRDDNAVGLKTRELQCRF